VCFDKFKGDGFLGIINSDIAELLLIAKNMQAAVSSIETTRVSILTKYRQLEVDWNDRKYKELGDIVLDSTKALNSILKSLLQGEKYVLQLSKALQEYNDVNFNGNGLYIEESVVTNHILQTPISPYTSTKQTEHRGIIDSRDGQIAGVISDVKNGSGRDISITRSEELLDSLHDYSGPFYNDIRYAYNNPNVPERLWNALNNVDEYVNSVLKWEGTIFRGINVSNEVAQQILSSQTIDMLGPSSWSTSEDIAQRFAYGDEPVRMVFVLAENLSGASITHLATYNGNEEEVLAPSGVQYVADSVAETIRDGHTYIYIHVHEHNYS